MSHTGFAEHRLVIDHDVVSRGGKYQYRYYFELDGVQCGSSQVDRKTRNHVFSEIDKIAKLMSSEREQDGRAAATAAREVGVLLYNAFIPEKLREHLGRLVAQNDGATIMLTAFDKQLPWELLHDGVRFLSTSLSLGRGWGKSHPVLFPPAGPVRILLVVNPCGSLAAAQEEGAYLQALFLKTGRQRGMKVEIEPLIGKAATISAVISRLATHPWDIVHFACHGWIEASKQSDAYLQLAGNTRLTARDLETIRLQRPALIFANACHAGSVKQRAAVFGDAPFDGLAPAFSSAGCLAYIAPFWPVSDDGAKEVAKAFYSALLGANEVGRALTAARASAPNPTSDPTHLAYALFGDPGARLVPLQAGQLWGPFTDDSGFARVIQLERRLAGRELLVTDSLPWIVWPAREFRAWIKRTGLGADRAHTITLELIKHQQWNLAEVCSGKKKLVCIANKRASIELLDRCRNDPALGLLEKLAATGSFLFLVEEHPEPMLETYEIVSASAHTTVARNSPDEVAVIAVKHSDGRGAKSPAVSGLRHWIYVDFDRRAADAYSNRFRATLTWLGHEGAMEASRADWIRLSTATIAELKSELVGTANAKAGGRKRAGTYVRP